MQLDAAARAAYLEIEEHLLLLAAKARKRGGV